MGDAGIYVLHPGDSRATAKASYRCGIHLTGLFMVELISKKLHNKDLDAEARG